MGTTTTTAVTPAPANAKRHTLEELLKGDRLKSAIATSIPKHLSAERFIRVALNATMRTPELLDCTPESLFKCLLDLSTYGLEPDGRRAHLIPFNRKIKTPGKPDRWVKDVQLIIDYKGIAELVRRSGDVSYIHADVVYEGDEWSFGFGTDAHLKHKPRLQNRGKNRVAFYSFVRLKDGSEDFIVMSPDAVEAIHQRSKSKDSGPWITDYDEMGKKTVFRNHSKWLPFSSELRDAVEADDDGFEGQTIDLQDSLKAASEINADLRQEALSKLDERLLEEQTSKGDGEVLNIGQQSSDMEQEKLSPETKQEQQQQSRSAQPPQGSSNPSLFADALDTTADAAGSRPKKAPRQGFGDTY